MAGGSDGRGGVIAVFGPTASGKSAVADALAERLPARLLSADALQVYRDIPILTNQPAADTALVGLWALDHEASVAEYAVLAHRSIDESLAAGHVPVVVGGTGLYLRAALAELAVPPAPAPGVRERFEALYDEVGAEDAHKALTERDPAAAERIHPNDRRRVVRALELHEAGSSLSPAGDRLWTGQMRHRTLVTGLDVPQEVVAKRIALRTRAMLAHGVQDEAREALAGPISKTARQAIGLHEFAELPEEEAVAAVVQKTLRYAAYQRKWMRRIPGLVSLPADRPPGVIADEILEMARARQLVPAPRAG